MRAIITDSHRMALRTWGRVMPTARSRPSSRRRSCTDRARVLAMPMRAITMASAEQPVDQVEDDVDLAGDALLEGGLVLQLAVGPPGQDGVEGGLGLGRADPVGHLHEDLTVELVGDVGLVGVEADHVDHPVDAGRRPVDEGPDGELDGTGAGEGHGELVAHRQPVGLGLAVLDGHRRVR